jgi:hypothetical protein
MGSDCEVVTHWDLWYGLSVIVCCAVLLSRSCCGFIRFRCRNVCAAVSVVCVFCIFCHTCSWSC